jgi:hypothetical protein
MMLAHSNPHFALNWSGLCSIQINLEDGLERVARASGRPAILLCDRGLMDGAAYMVGALWGC